MKDKDKRVEKLMTELAATRTKLHAAVLENMHLQRKVAKMEAFLLREFNRIE